MTSRKTKCERCAAKDAAIAAKIAAGWDGEDTEPMRDKSRLYADFLKRKADTAPDSGLVWISAVDAEEISILLRK